MMKYNVYIDESGSINDHGKAIFEVAMLFVSSDLDKKTRNFFRKKFLKFKQNNKIPLNNEIKAHYLWKNKLDFFVDEIFEYARENNKIVSGYINNRRKISSGKRYRGKEQEFYHMLNLMIQRAIDKGYINKGDSLNIICDKRNELPRQITRLSSSSFKQYGIKIVNFEFIDSKKDIMIQVADIVSAKCFRDIMLKLSKNIKLKNEKNRSIREIFY